MKKTENRKPKSEGTPKSEIRIGHCGSTSAPIPAPVQQSARPCENGLFGFRISSFGFLSGFGSRLSDFALRRALPIWICGLASLVLPALAVTPGSLGALRQPLRAPAGVATDAAGNAYVTDPGAGQVVVFNAFGQPLAVHGGLGRPLAIAVDAAGTIYLSDERAGSVAVFNSQWVQLGTLGQGTNEFLRPSHLAIDPSAPNTVYVCDSAADQVKVYRDRAFAFAFGGSGSSPGQFNFPAGIYASPQGALYVVDQGNDRVETFDRAGNCTGAFVLGAGGMFGGVSGRAQGITGDGTGTLYVADAFQDEVKVFSANGAYVTALGGYSAVAGQLRSPTGLAVDPFHRLLVASPNNGAVTIFGLPDARHFSVTPPLQVVAAGAAVTFSVATSDSAATYQWRKGGSSLTDGGNLSGATTPALRLNFVTKADAGNYSVEVTGTGGAWTSPVAPLIVLAPPAIAMPPASLSVLRGETAEFRVVAAGDGLAIQWLFQDQPLAGATNATLTIANAQSTDAGSYRVALSNAVGALTSDAAGLTVTARPNPPTLSTLALQPDGSMQLLFSGDAGFTYRIEISTDLVTWTELASVYSENGSVEYFDGTAPDAPARFYRLRWEP